MSTGRVLTIIRILTLSAVCCGSAYAGTYEVPNTQPKKITTETLEKGRWYTLRAKGEVSDWKEYDDGVDAVWCYAEWRCQREGKDRLPWQQLRINDKGMMDIAGKAIPYNESHVYEVQILGEGQPLTLYMSDAMHSSSNNKGSIFVTLTPGQHGGADSLNFRSIEEAMAWVEKRPGRGRGEKWSTAVKNDAFKQYWDSLRNTDHEESERLRDWARRDFEYHPGETEKTIRRIPNTATKDYVCHDFAWRTGKDRTKRAKDTNYPLQRGGRGNRIENKSIEELMESPEDYGYTEVGLYDLKPGDIVVYGNSPGEALHSALVKSASQPSYWEMEHDFDPTPDVTLVSKESQNSLFEHKLGSHGDPNNFFRATFGLEGVRFFRKL